MKRYILLALFAMTTQAHGKTFDQMWSDRVVAFIRTVRVTQVNVDDIPARLFEPPQQEKVEEPEEPKKVHKHKDPECLTLREARREYPSRYLSWRGHHCWFAPGRHH